MISDTAKENAEKLLENWGNWCREDWHRHLDYTKLPTSRDYRAPIQQVTRVRPPIIVEDAELANEAILSLPQSGAAYFDIYNFIVSVWAHQRSWHYMMRKLDCSQAGYFRARDRAILAFIDAYREQLLLHPRKSEKSVAK